jgi:hypothetical protein
VEDRISELKDKIEIKEKTEEQLVKQLDLWKEYAKDVNATTRRTTNPWRKSEEDYRR